MEQLSFIQRYQLWISSGTTKYYCHLSQFSWLSISSSSSSSSSPPPPPLWQKHAILYFRGRKWRHLFRFRICYHVANLLQQQNKISKFSESSRNMNDTDLEDYFLLGCDTFQSGREVLMFWGNLLPPSPTLKKEAAFSPKISALFYQTTQQHIPENDIVHNYHNENLKLQIMFIL